MSKVEKRTFSITAEQAEFIDAKVKSGGYASSSEVVREGLRALQDHDAMIERWLEEEVIPTYDRWKAGLEETYTTEEVSAHLEERRRLRSTKKAS